MAITGLSTLGVAKARLEFDLSGLNAAASQAQRVGAVIQSAFGRIEAGAKRAASTFSSIGRGLNSFRGELIAIGAAGGVISGIGLAAASGLQGARIVLKGMTGDIKTANALIDDLRQQAAAAGIPFQDMLSVATQMLPTLEGNTQELQKWVDLTRRVAVLNQREGVGGAAFAIREALSSGGTDLVSLAERFNISRVQLRTALEQTSGDFAAALDIVLTKMGITQEAADEMGTSFQAAMGRLRDSVSQFLATGFEPFLDDLTKAVDRLNEFLTNLRETHPELAKLGAQFGFVTTLAVPALLVLGQLASSLEKLKPLFIGLKNIITGPIGAILGGFATGFSVLGPKVFGGENRAQLGLMDIPNAARLQFQGRFGDQAGRQRAINEFNLAYGTDQMKRRFSENASFDQAMIRRGATPGSMPAEVVRPTDLIESWNEDMADIEKQAQEERLSATETYERQRSDAIESYERSIARTAEDYARQRARAEEDYQRSVADFREEIAKRESEMQVNLDKALVKIHEDTGKRINDIEEQTAEQREQLVDDHRLRILQAASRLDASAIAEENRRFKQRQDQITKNESKQISEVKEAADEQTAELLAAHQERLEQAREADAERLRDMEEAHQLQRDRADEDYNFRLQRMAEDHQDQLMEMDRAHQLRLTQIQDHAQQERDARDIEFQKALAKENLATEAFLTAERLRKAAALRNFEEWWDDINGIMRKPSGGTTGAGETPITLLPPERMERFAEGGAVRRTGPVLAHAGEYILSPETTAALSRLMGGISQPGLMAAAAGGSGGLAGSSTTVTVAPGAININESATPALTAAAVEDMLTEIIRGLV